MASWQDLRSSLERYNQEHLLAFLEELSDDENEERLRQFHKELSELDLPHLDRCFREVSGHIGGGGGGDLRDEDLKPLEESICGSTRDGDPEEIKRWEMLGLQLISEGKVAVLLLAGGQGTRLGVDYPKGMFDVGLPSGKTLYQLQAERILRLQAIAGEKLGKDCVIPWYIMTSEHTKGPTLDFFRKHNFFSLKSENIVVFEQNTIPCFDFQGKILLQDKHSIARSPDGNGGLYSALVSSETGTDVLADMEQRGISYVHVYCVDNILVKMADPVFVGFCSHKKADCGAKVVRKNFPDERVGVVCVCNDKYQVVEYSEISSGIAERRDSDGTLSFKAGNICNHFFTLEFLKNAHKENWKLRYHVAKKKIPFVNQDGMQINPSEPNGIKLEKFVFDVFRFSNNFAVLEVLREDEFSPLKNAAGTANKDTPETARSDLLDLHRRWIEAAGASVKVDSDTTTNGIPVQCEISPLLSYAGENLEKYKGKNILAPAILELNGTRALAMS